ncbi:hypothetical protein OG559_31140 (plasmid) [Micromonospora sp. NBC_01405]|uniref:hypothetical protein n=1 Tax=Micromonospora sp. NBC_01405 TaxID=2903589 RepID=UPI00324965C3
MIVTTRQEKDGIEIVEFDRAEFLERVWPHGHKPGDRVSIIGPSEAGKTQLGFQLLDAVTTPELPAVVLVMKPEDDTVKGWGRKLKFKTLKSWPPPLSLFESRKPSGYLLWPPHNLENFGATNLRMYQNFHRAVIDIYRHRKTRAGKKLDGMILFADELAGLDDELGMEAEIKMMYSRGRTMHAGIWGATQRPVDVPKLAYSSANHLFLSYMPDQSDRRRFAEIGGGVDSQLIEAITLRLPQYWWLYIRRADRTLCIVRA